LCNNTLYDKITISWFRYH